VGLEASNGASPNSLVSRLLNVIGARS